MNEPANETLMAVARAKRRFPGHDVEDVYPIGWPVHSVRLTLTVLAEHTIATAARFILRLVGRESAGPAALSRLLGMSDKFIAAAAAELVDKELVVQRPDLHLEITEQGRQAIANGGRSWSPQREHTEVPFCPITRRVLGAYDLDLDDLMYPDVAGKNGLFVLPAGDKPRLRELRIEAIRDCAHAGQGIKPEEITEVAEIHNRNARLRYRTDITIVKLVASSNNRMTFAAFRGHEYLEEETIALQRLADSGVNLVPEEYTYSTTDILTQATHASRIEEDILADIRENDRVVHQIEQAIVEAEASRQDTQDDRERSELEQRIAVLEAQKSALTDKLAESEQKLNEETSGEVRVIYTKEHRPLLLDAIDKAKSEVILVSAFISPKAFDNEVRRKLRQAMTRGVHVRIAWGLGTTGQTAEAVRKRTRGEYVIAELKRGVPKTVLEQRLMVKRTETHEKFIICDEQFCVWGSFNWLSYRGDGYRRETSDYSERLPDIARRKAVAAELFGKL